MADGQAWEYRRIETLIPYREPSWTPAADTRLPKLSSKLSSWSMMAKLGSYLLSSIRDDRDALTRVAVSSYGRLFGTDGEVVGAADPACFGRVEERISRELSECTDAILLKSDRDSVAACNGTLSERQTLIAAGFSGMKAKFLDTTYFGFRGVYTLPFVGFRLDAAVGILALIDATDADEARQETRLRGEASIAAQAAAIERLRSVWIRDDNGMYREPKGDGQFVHVRNLDFLLERKGDDLARLRAATESPESFETSLMRAARRMLLAPKYARRGGFEDPEMLGGALSFMEERFWNEETNRELNRRFAREEERQHSARVWDFKKNLDPAHVAAARSGFIGSSFREVEIDDSVDLGEYGQLQEEFLRRFSSRELPQVDADTLALRFRKCGRHHAFGLYSPNLRTVVVDPRHPASLLHEFAHAYDFAHGQLSCRGGFSRIVRDVREDLVGAGLSDSAFRYAVTPTEVFARAWEVYASESGIGGSFVKTPEEYEANAIYAPLLERSDVVFDFFERILPEKEKPLPIEGEAPELVESRARAALDGVLPGLGHDWGGDRDGEGATIPEHSWEAASMGQQFSLF